MGKLGDYIYRPIEINKTINGKSICEFVKNNLYLVIHSFLPHSQPVEPPKKIQADSIGEEGNELDSLSEYSSEIYEDSKDRIKALEDKAFKLMTYISALTAILIFILNKEIGFFTKIFSIISIAILILALLISLRCIGIKTQRTFFIDAIFDFTNEIPKAKKQKDIIISRLENALFNQNIADNTADIIKASRILLLFGIITTSISFICYFGSKKEIDINDKKMGVNNYYLDSLYKSPNKMFLEEVNCINSELNSISKDLDSIKKVNAVLIGSGMQKK